MLNCSFIFLCFLQLEKIQTQLDALSWADDLCQRQLFTNSHGWWYFWSSWTDLSTVSWTVKFIRASCSDFAFPALRFAHLWCKNKYYMYIIFACAYYTSTCVPKGYTIVQWLVCWSVNCKVGVWIHARKIEKFLLPSVCIWMGSTQISRNHNPESNKNVKFTEFLQNNLSSQK